MACSCGANHGQRPLGPFGNGEQGVPALDERASGEAWQHAVAGSAAGVMEHVGMYPLDTLKTRMQALSVNLGVRKAFQSVLRERGWLGLMRGSTVIGAGCIPAHSSMFCSYEFAKARLPEGSNAQQVWLRDGMCGALAALAHDGVLTPCDCVKQRLQLGGYAGALDCVVNMWRHEGVLALCRSLPATLMMNVPYNSVLVAMNESLKRTTQDKYSGLQWYFAFAGVSGAVASAATLPLDVVKTRLQTQGLHISASAEGEITMLGCAEVHCNEPVDRKYHGIFPTMRLIWREEGARGFFRGLVPRVALAMPSAALCWGTYEMVHRLLHRVAEFRQGNDFEMLQVIPTPMDVATRMASMVTATATVLTTTMAT
eukprot:CAMPEP_0117533032 /NCGR_PEP_ID=MMETSP0784-20121206/39677_1 /TAXON_ID=39447 /ORGANISM="" /LENGTH=369 /DNA_ID=CAMNT_0005329449 /DNA_START=95 /DNA_END=1205 /DNA_ORIENTATION=-